MNHSYNLQIFSTLAFSSTFSTIAVKPLKSIEPCQSYCKEDLLFVLLAKAKKLAIKLKKSLRFKESLHFKGTQNLLDIFITIIGFVTLKNVC